MKLCGLNIRIQVALLSCAMAATVTVPCAGQGGATATFPVNEFEKFGGIVYRTGEDYRLTLDVYVPEGEGPFPAVLAVHGGSWRSGTKLNWFRHARRIARAGFVVVAINYRHAPEFQFPAQIHDCKAAVRWMRTNAATYKIDAERIGAVGYSAGGHLVALLGTTESADGLEGDVPSEESGVSTRLRAVACGGAPCEFTWLGDESRSLAFWLGDSRAGNPEIYRVASATTYISPDDPPFHFFHGTEDMLVPESSPRRMHQLLLQNSVESEFVPYEGYGHFGLFGHVAALDPVIEFLDRELRK
ncbi:MAG: alpha/beta hydrolase fold domain-containing protein [Pirellulaceae bacterium]